MTVLYFQVKQDVGQIDILVNNAGIVTGKKFLDCSDSMIQKTMDVNIIAHFWVSTVKILKIGTPEIITVIVLQLEQLDFTV